nr:MAG TPA: hypothetical protein [Caudoviricetes sp.]
MIRFGSFPDFRASVQAWKAFCFPFFRGQAFQNSSNLGEYQIFFVLFFLFILFLFTSSLEEVIESLSSTLTLSLTLSLSYTGGLEVSFPPLRFFSKPQGFCEFFQSLFGLHHFLPHSILFCSVSEYF